MNAISKNSSVLIIGAGVIGMTTAYALAKRGVQVTVIERESAPAELCSFGNAGIMSLGHTKAWAGPDAIRTFAQAATGRNPAIKFTHFFDPALWRWGISFLANCPSGAHKRNSDKIAQICYYSRELVQKMAADLNISASLKYDGGLYVFQDKAQFDQYVATVGQLEGADYQVLDRDELLNIEPGLKRMANLAGGLFSPRDAVGDCRTFVQSAGKALLSRKNVSFEFDTTVSRILTKGRKVLGVRTDRGDFHADAIVVTAGLETPDLCRDLGINPRMYPVKGYSGTWPILSPECVPKFPMVDETELLAIANYGDRLRVTAIAEFAGQNRELVKERLMALRDYVDRSFGDAVDQNNASFWAGLRPVTPSGAPYIGQLKNNSGIWINAGHGPLGWTMSFASAELLAQKMLNLPLKLQHVSATCRGLVSI